MIPRLLFVLATPLLAQPIPLERLKPPHAAPVAFSWYPAGHDLNDPAAWAERARWLEKHIGLRGAVEELRRTVK